MNHRITVLRHGVTTANVESVIQGQLDYPLSEAGGRPGDEPFPLLEHPPAPYEPVFRSGESEWDLYLRAAGAVQSLVRRPPGAYLVVSHGAILNAALRSILGIPPRGRAWPTRFVFDNTGYAVLEDEPASAPW